VTTDRETMITPDMKVGTLLDTFPELESVLIEMAPTFKKLQNPVLRKTVAKVTTLERAAGIANIPTRDLIIKLRTIVGQPTLETDLAELPSKDCGCFPDTDPSGTAAGQSADHSTAESCDPPLWFAEDRVRETIDADAMLAAGEVPISRIVESAKTLAAKDILRVTVDFKPLPMIEMLDQKGFETFHRRTSNNAYELFIHTGSESQQA